MFCKVTNIIKYTPASTMIDNYHIAQKEIREAFDLLNSAKIRLGANFGEYYNRIFPHNFRDDQNFDRVLLESLNIVHRNAWKGIIQKTQIKKLLTRKRRDQLDNQLEEGKLPELDHKTLADMLSDMSKSIDKYFKEAVKEIFEKLRPRRSGLSTNSEFEIGKKVIVWGMISSWSSLPSLSRDGESDLNSMENVFSLLEGKGIVKYPDDAATIVKEAMDKGLWNCETKYFELKWHKNENMHIVFKRLDLVNEINRIAGGNRIKP